MPLSDIQRCLFDYSAAVCCTSAKFSVEAFNGQGKLIKTWTIEAGSLTQYMELIGRKGDKLHITCEGPNPGTITDHTGQVLGSVKREQPWRIYVGESKTASLEIRGKWQTERHHQIVDLKSKSLVACVEREMPGFVENGFIDMQFLTALGEREKMLCIVAVPYIFHLKCLRRGSVVLLE